MLTQAAVHPEVSIVIPCLDEEENVNAITKAVIQALTEANATYEIIFIDNGSTDKTVALIKALCAEDRSIRLIVNNKNYGQMRSPTHAIYQTSGRAVIAMCADFQDPPSMIPEFVSRWRSGVPIVLGVRRSEKMSPLMRLSRSLGYGFFAKFGDYPVIPGATGFGLYDRAVVDELSRWREPEPFFRGMLVESGFELETIPYERPPRAGGRAKNNFGTLLSFAISGVASSSRRLLRAPFWFAVLSAGAAGGCLLIGLLSLILGDLAWAWFAAAAGEFNVAIVAGFLGLIGEQVRLTAERERNVPLVIEKERVNFSRSIG